MIVNGVTLPDIPADIRALHLYWYIEYVDSNISFVDGCRLHGCNEAMSYVDGSLLGAPYGMLLNTTPGYAMYRINLDGEWDYLSGSESETASSVIGTIQVTETSSETHTLVWSDHDIRTVTGFDEATGGLLYGDIYFPDSETPEAEYAERYSILGSILVGTARQIMRLTDSAQKVKPEEFEAKMEGINIQLQELTVTATEDVQTITPPSGIYGFSKVIVEAVEDSGGTGGGGTGGEGGEGSGETFASAENVKFGTETVEEEQPTGYVIYGDFGKFSPLPGNYPYCHIPFNGAATPWAYEYDGICYDNSWDESKVVLTPYSAITYQAYRYNSDTNVWAKYGDPQTKTDGFGTISMTNLYTNYGFVRKNFSNAEIEAGDTEIEMETVEVKKPVAVDETYTISGETMNDLGNAIQELTGANASTPSGMISALETYIANQNNATS